MKLTPIATNQTEVSYNNGLQVFFSYRTPVAAFEFGRGYIKTEQFWSVTTSRHINKWGAKEGEEVPQEYLNNLV